jgi:hypothetical protein
VTHTETQPEESATIPTAHILTVMEILPAVLATAESALTLIHTETPLAISAATE